MRGTCRDRNDRLKHHRVSPTYVGNTGEECGNNRASQGQPHMHGEYGVLVGDSR